MKAAQRVEPLIFQIGAELYSAEGLAKGLAHGFAVFRAFDIDLQAILELLSRKRSWTVGCLRPYPSSQHCGFTALQFVFSTLQLLGFVMLKDVVLAAKAAKSRADVDVPIVLDVAVGAIYLRLLLGQ